MARLPRVSGQPAWIEPLPKLRRFGWAIPTPRARNFRLDPMDDGSLKALRPIGKLGVVWEREEHRQSVSLGKQKHRPRDPTF